MQDRAAGRSVCGENLHYKSFHFRQFHWKLASNFLIIKPTVGVDFVSKTVNVENKSLRMQLWDTAGQERFHSLIPSYIRDCNSAVIVYDITSKNNKTVDANSYNNLGKWIDSVREVRGE